MASTSDNDVLAPSSLRLSTINHPYGSSIASSASSSSSSIFSLESQSSIASSSTSSLNAVWENENEDEYFSNYRSSQESAPERSPRIKSSDAKPIERRAQLPCQPVAPEARKHPRRTHRLPPISVNNGVWGSCSRPPPALVRQCERKDNFVDSLVGKITCLPHPDTPIAYLTCRRYYNPDD